jgi:Bacteriophage Mu, Gp27
MSKKRSEKENGILNRARPVGTGGQCQRKRSRSRAEQGPSPSSSPLQGEGKTGEETDGKPKRVPIDPIPFKTWKIKKLPPDLKEQLDRMLTEGTLHSCRQLSKWLGDNGFEISHAAIHKYGQKFERRLEAIRMATEQARIVCEQFKDDDAQMQSALMRLVQTRLFEVLAVANQREEKSATPGDGTIAPVNITALARSVSGLAKAETEHRKWVERAREGVAAAGKKVEEATAKGLSKEAAEQIKAVLLEIER